MRKDKQRSLVMSCGGGVSAAGLAILVRGIWLASHAAGWIAAGLLIALPGLFFAYDAFRER